MCGIAGIITLGKPGLEAALSRAVASQAHRGPDDEGTYVGPFGCGVLALGHRRLSILELSEAGHQPMVHPHTGDVLTYNGELYNHQEIRHELEKIGSVFIGHSDTEVLLHALTRWGVACLSRLEGMYAFAFFDKGQQRLILARDPLGIKPLYWAVGADCLVFASEVKGILATNYIEPALDRSGIGGMLAYGAVQQPRTIFRDIRAFPAGSTMELQASEFVPGSWPATARHWTFPGLALPSGVGDPVGRTRELLTRAVGSHLMSDVPVGIFLSAGIDSTIIASIAAGISPDIQAFTVGFLDTLKENETTMAAHTSAGLRLRHTSLWIDAEQGRHLANDWLRGLDQPCMDGLNTYVISKLVRDTGIKVALSGQGGDELFGGYPSFFDVPRIRSAMRLVRRMPLAQRRIVARILGAGRSTVFRDKLIDIASTRGSLTDIYLQRRRTLSNRQMQMLGVSDHPDRSSYLEPECLDDMALNDADEFYSLSLLETKMYLGNTLLHVSDATSMASGLEIRVPYLDRSLTEFALSLPGENRIGRRRQAKFLLRSAFGDLLRPEILSKKKQGFVFPIGRWMTGPWRDFSEDALNSLVESGSVEERGVREIWAEFLREPETPLWSRAWVLIVLGTYLKNIAGMRTAHE
jgi:asparagine synthase (glutamine-hydrolysing)